MQRPDAGNLPETSLPNADPVIHTHQLCYTTRGTQVGPHESRLKPHEGQF